MSKKLHALIKSLSGTEKAHFKKLSQKHAIGDQKVYVSLFDVIDSMKEYDQSLLQKAFQKQKTLHDISVYSNYLFKNVLDSLKIYNARKTVESKIKQLLLDVEMLFLKGLFSEARKINEKAKKEALKYEHILLLAEAHNWEEKLIKYAPFDSSSFGKAIHKNHFDGLEIIKKLRTLREYKWLVNRIFYLHKRAGNFVEGGNELKELDELMQHRLLTSEEKAILNSEKTSYYQIHSLYNSIKRQPDIYKAIEYSRKHKELLENNIQWVSQYISSYLNVSHNLLFNYIQTWQLKEFDKVIEDIKTIPEKFFNKIGAKDENQRLSILNIYFIIRCSVTGEYEKGIAAIKGKEAQLEQLHSTLAREGPLVFHYNVSQLFFGAGNFKKALFWINKVLNAPEKTLRPDMRIHAMIWNAIINYELRNYESIEPLIKSAIRFLDQYPTVYLFERFFLKNILGLVKAQNISEEAIIKHLLVFRKKITEFKNKTNEIQEIECLTYLSWLDSHITKKKFSDVYKSLISRKFSK